MWTQIFILFRIALLKFRVENSRSEILLQIDYQIFKDDPKFRLNYIKKKSDKLFRLRQIYCKINQILSKAYLAENFGLMRIIIKLVKISFWSPAKQIS